MKYGPFDTLRNRNLPCASAMTSGPRVAPESSRTYAPSYGLAAPGIDDLADDQAGRRRPRRSLGPGRREHGDKTRGNQ